MKHAALSTTILLAALAALEVTAAPGTTRGLIYGVPPSQAELRFSHATGAHAALACTRCHAAARSSVSVKDRLLPGEASCRPCHREARRAGELAPTAALPRDRLAGCTRCHPGYSGLGAPIRVTVAEAKLRFAHRIHLERGVDCAGCHAMRGAGEVLPRMASCMGCHAKRKVSNRCVTCHLAEKDGRLRTRFEEGVLKPSGSLKADRHDRSFARGHASVARTEKRYCESCHQPSSCLAGCHAGTRRPASIHPNDYVTLHVIEARREPTRCRSCHASQSFCLGCHQRVGVGKETARSGFRPDTGRRFHPAGFATLQAGPGHHGRIARRNATSCSSCHREETCVRCHGTRSLGRGGFSPHGPGFAGSAKCRALSARNQRVCLKCHPASGRHTACRL